jgi:hypothetical protein
MPTFPRQVAQPAWEGSGKFCPGFGKPRWKKNHHELKPGIAETNMLLETIPTPFTAREVPDLPDLPWAGQVTFSSHGLRLGVRVDRRELLPRVHICLPPDWQLLDEQGNLHWFSIVTNGNASWTLFSGSEQLWLSTDADDLLQNLEAEIQIYVAEWAKQYIFVHAGVVGLRGGGVLIPGRSFSGKSTLVASLLRAGATYYSDEYAILDEHGRVFPYPRRLALRKTDRSPDRRCGPDELGSRAGREPLPVAYVVVAQYRFGETWRPRRLSSGQALLELVENTVSMQRQPDRALTPLLVVAQQAKVLKGWRGEAVPTAATLLSQLQA